jgi:hypothetical protein
MPTAAGAAYLGEYDHKQQRVQPAAVGVGKRRHELAGVQDEIHACAGLPTWRLNRDTWRTMEALEVCCRVSCVPHRRRSSHREGTWRIFNMLA